MEYINFEHNETAAELVRAAYDTPPLAFVHSYGCQQNVNDGERIAQMIVAKYEQAELVPVDVLDETERGEGGFGHSGVK